MFRAMAQPNLNAPAQITPEMDGVSERTPQSTQRTTAACPKAP